MFVVHIIRQLCLRVPTNVSGVKRDGFNDYIFLHSHLQISFCIVTLVHIKGNNKITNNNAGNKIKRGALPLRFVIAFLISVKQAVHIQHRAFNHEEKSQISHGLQESLLLALINPPNIYD